MRIPLVASVREDKVRISRNGRIEEVPLPIRPFILCREDQFVGIVEGPAETWTKIPERKKYNYIRASFQNMDDLFNFKKRHIDKQSYMMSNNTLEQILISCPDFFYQHPHTRPLKIMFFDIEVASKGDGFFPRPIANEILCIGYSIWEYREDGSRKKVVHKIISGFELDAEIVQKSTAGDREILRQFVQEVKDNDPDIIAGYNSEEFDFPYIIERCQLLDISMEGMGRGDRELFVSNRDGKIVVPGRIHFDIYNSNAGVIKDQTLFGLKSRSLKEIARFYNARRTTISEGESKLEDIEVQEHMEDLLSLYRENPERLYAYQNDDIYRTEWVGQVYMRNCITLAEMLGCPISSIIGMYSSFVPKIVVARHMEKRRLINTESNFQRYNNNTGSIAQLGTKYEGAVVGLYKDGFFPHVYKLDFSSQYPSSIQTWNLGPDTTSFVEKLPYTGRYTFRKDSKYNWYRIPDANFKCDVVVKVRNNVDGLLKSEISRLRTERAKIKKQLKVADKSDKPALDSQQYAIKVVLNSLYGFLGLKSSMYGDMISAMMVTAMCRWTTIMTMHRLADYIIEVDTDGVILNRAVDDTEINEWLNKLMKDAFGIEDNYMQMELEEFGRAYFYAMKNYIVQDGEKFVLHGSSMKASRIAKVVDRAVHLGIQHVFNNKPSEEVLAEALDFDSLELEDFEERIKLAKEPVEYDDQLDMRLYLAKQMELKTGQQAAKGVQLSYVVAKERLALPELLQYNREGSKNYTFIKWITSKDELDFNYYKEIVMRVLGRFGVKEQDLQLDLFGGQYKSIQVAKKLDVIPELLWDTDGTKN